MSLSLCLYYQLVYFSIIDCMHFYLLLALVLFYVSVFNCFLFDFYIGKSKFCYFGMIYLCFCC